MPGLIGATIDWFKYYEMPNKPPYEFAFDENKEFAVDIIQTLHDQWNAMMKQVDDPIEVSRHCTIFDGYSKINQEDASMIVESHDPPSFASELPNSVDKWHYIKLGEMNEVTIVLEEKNSRKNMASTLVPQLNQNWMAIGTDSEATQQSTNTQNSKVNCNVQ